MNTREGHPVLPARLTQLADLAQVGADLMQHIVSGASMEQKLVAIKNISHEAILALRIQSSQLDATRVSLLAALTVVADIVIGGAFSEGKAKLIKAYSQIAASRSARVNSAALNSA